MKYKYAFLYPIVLSLFISYTVLIINGGKMRMDTGIIVGLIAVAGSLIGLIIQFKKDSNTIGTVKSDTSEIKPKIANIDENSRKSRDILIEDVKPSIDKLYDQQTNFEKNLSKIDYVVKEFEYQDRLKKEYSSGFNKDILTTGIDAVYERNAMLENQLREKKIEISELINKVRLLNAEKQSLEQQLEEYKESIERDDFNHKMRF